MTRRKDTQAAPGGATPPEGGAPAAAAPQTPEASPGAGDGNQDGGVSAPPSATDPETTGGADPADAQAPDATPAAAPGGTAAGTPDQDESRLLVRGPAKGRWRAGRKFGPEPTAIPLTELTEEQVAALRADPELLVTEL